ncbi:MAG: cohesin domain-containing protein [Euryarchaeota archaeon]|nr:cohesin domain-containing protein [Euryarchaeota archaeon]
MSGWIRLICLSVIVFLSIPLVSATTISIADVDVEYGSTIIAPIRIANATILGGCEINITYNSSVVYVTGVTPGDMNLLAYNIDNEFGWVYVNAINVSGQNGDATLACVNLTAVGDVADVSPLNITAVTLFDTDYNRTPCVTRNGSFTVLPSGVATISIGNGSDIMTTSIAIEDGANVCACDITLTFNASVVNVTDVTCGDMDVTMANLEHVHEGFVRIGTFQTDNPGMSGNIAFANVTFEPVGNIGDTCSLNLSVTTFKDATSIGNEMPYLVRNGTYTVLLLNGDVNDDDVVDIHDAMYLAKHVLGITGFEVTIVEAADVNDDKVIDIADAMYLAKHVLGITGFEELR